MTKKTKKKLYRVVQRRTDSTSFRDVTFEVSLEEAVRVHNYKSSTEKRHYVYYVIEELT